MLKRAWIGWLAIVAGVSLVSCDLGEKIDTATIVIDQGLQDLDDDATMWADVVQRVSRELPDTVAETLREEAETLAVRAVAAAEGGVQCSVDFLYRRTRQSLRRLKDLIGGGSPAPLPPAFCLVAPASIDLSTDPASWDTATLHGYDMDAVDASGRRIGFAAIGPSGAKVQDLPEGAIGRTTHYQVTLNLRDVVARLHTSGAMKVVPTWESELGGMASGEIVVKRWSGKPRPEKHPPGRTTFVPPHGQFGQPYNCGGDRDFSLGIMEMHLEAKISQILPDRIEATVFMFAKEGKPDYTCVVGTKTEVLYQAPAGWKVVGIRQDAPCRHDFNITQHGLIPVECAAGTVAKRMNVYGDGPGDEAGSRTQVVVEWRDLDVQLEPLPPPWLTG